MGLFDTERQCLPITKSIRNVRPTILAVLTPSETFKNCKKPTYCDKHLLHLLVSISGFVGYSKWLQGARRGLDIFGIHSVAPRTIRIPRRRIINSLKFFRWHFKTFGANLRNLQCPSGKWGTTRDQFGLS